MRTLPGAAHQKERRRSSKGRNLKYSCVVTAHHAKTGKELWRTNLIPRPGEPGDETYLLYIGTSVTAPAPKFMLAGNDHEYLYHNSTLALNADTGKIVWHYQHLVDHWDFDHPFGTHSFSTPASVCD
jgi:outer membrane protein assembly factor BamB